MSLSGEIIIGLDSMLTLTGVGEATHEVKRQIAEKENVCTERVNITSTQDSVDHKGLLVRYTIDEPF